MNIPKTAIIMDVEQEAVDIRTITFSYPFDTIPGQFFMIWLPDVDEIPMSVSYIIGEKKGITFRKVGEATNILYNLKRGDKIGVRGPYGNGFSIIGKHILFVGGGTGIAMLAPFIEKVKSMNIPSTVIIGAKKKNEIIFKKRIEKYCENVIVITDDGSSGKKGQASEIAKNFLQDENFDSVITCGPELMMKNLLKYCNNIYFQASMERYMKCAIGLCGQCCIGEGLRVCKDGPIFDGKILRDIKDFGKYRRDAAGRIIPFLGEIMLQNKKLYFFIILGFILIIFISLSIIAVITPRSNIWATEITQIEKLHKLGFDGSNVTIGIIDTGVSIEHQDFDSASFIAWVDIINDHSYFYDDEDYGTHIAGILAAKGSFQGIYSGINLRGIILNAKFVVAKSIPQNQYPFGGGNDSTLAAGIQFCIDNNVDIILLSMGSGVDNINFEENSNAVDKINNAIENGIFVVIPAGNDGQKDDGDVNYLANLENTISVGAISKGNSILSFSSQGHQYPNTIYPNKKPELVAPGDQIVSTRINGAYGEISGTSQAAAYVTGVIALLLDAYPEYKHDGIKNENVSTIHLFKEIFAKTAKKVGNLMNSEDVMSHDDLYGYGIIQAYDSYLELAKY